MILFCYTKGFEKTCLIQKFKEVKEVFFLNISGFKTKEELSRELLLYENVKFYICLSEVVLNALYDSFDDFTGKRAFLCFDLNENSKFQNEVLEFEKFLLKRGFSTNLEESGNIKIFC